MSISCRMKWNATTSILNITKNFSKINNWGSGQLFDTLEYKEINGALICKIAHEIKRSAGTSNLDANEWHHILASSSFGDNSREFCSTIALMGKKIMFKEILWKWWITRSLLSMQTYSLRQESWSKSCRD